MKGKWEKAVQNHCDIRSLTSQMERKVCSVRGHIESPLGDLVVHGAPHIQSPIPAERAEKKGLM